MAKQDTKILRAIRHEFSRRPGFSISDRLRRLALSALDRDISAGRIARAAGISRQSVVNWRRQARSRGSSNVSLAPVELKVLEGAPPQIGMWESGSTVRILLRSGAMVEVPAALVDPSWLVALNGSAS